MKTVIPAFFLAGPTMTITADDAGAEHLHGTLRSAEPWLAHAERLLGTSRSEEDRGLVVGALPFSQDAPVRLFYSPEAVIRGAWPAAEDEEEVPPSASSASRLEGEAPDVAFLTAVERAVHAIEQGSLSKVVLARAFDLMLPRQVNVATLLRVLRTRNPYGFTYALTLPPADDASRAEGAGPKRSERSASRLVGASPELLLSRRGKKVVSVPLAGSIPRSARSDEDQQRAANLLRSAKDLHEHRLVVEYVLDTLAPLTRSLSHEREPVVNATPTMWHLSTRIAGELRDPDFSSLRVAAALHPTPAVCGLPTSTARAWIRESEPVDRGYFTGALGYTRTNGDGDWIVAIRCAEIAGAHVRAFAGAGIVRGSEPERELNETTAKMATVLRAIDAAEALSRRSPGYVGQTVEIRPTPNERLGLS